MSAGPPRPDLAAFAKFVAERRSAAGLTRTAVAQIVGAASCGSVTLWEEAKVEPHDSKLNRLSQWTGVPMIELARMLPSWAPSINADSDGARLVRARWRAGLSQREVAKRMGLAAGRYQAYENAGTIPWEILERIETLVGDTGIDSERSLPAPIRWSGGKVTMLNDLLPMIPVTRKYVEPYGGSASVLLARPRSKVEIYNDLNGDLANLFTMLRDEPEELHRRLSLTLPSRQEHQHAATTLRDPKAPLLQRAWAYFVVINQGFNGRDNLSTGNWSTRPGEWWKRVAWSGEWHQRLAGVIIENTDALGLIDKHDAPGTTFYLDPPYVRSVRKQTKTPLYRIEAGDDHHEGLVTRLLRLKGAAVLSGYASPLYEPLERAGWARHALKGDEVVWRNQRAVALAA